MTKTTKRFSVLNYKGGTGKTCTLVNLAHALSLNNFKVLIIDTDPQGSTSYHLGIQTTNTLYDVITESKPIEDCIISARENLDIIISNERLFPADHYMHKQNNREHILNTRLQSLNEKYDYIFLDCSPINKFNEPKCNDLYESYFNSCIYGIHVSCRDKTAYQ